MDFTKILTPLTELFPPSNLLKKKSLAFTVMILSPHPDDEAITGSLPLRLLRENGAHVVNVAVTLGSNEARREARRRELEAACAVLEFECVYLDEDWRKKERELKALVQKYQPSLVVAPHRKDRHPTHVKTGELCRKVLAVVKNGPVLVAWSEFWAPMAKPNLLLEVPREILELQMAALAEHVGEVSRNPYHLRLPAWMMDNVRRGSEVVAENGAAAATFPFGVLYQLQLWKNGKLTAPRGLPATLTTDSDLGQIFRLILEAAAGSKTRVK
jgi:LmbE family N-acetylglucosaminyl deacetylase